MRESRTLIRLRVGLAGAALVLGLPAAVHSAFGDVPTPIDSPVTVDLPVSAPLLPSLDTSILPTSDDVLDLAGVKCANPVLNDVPHHHPMNVPDQVTGALAYTWNVDITVTKRCNHPAFISSITTYATNVDTAHGYAFDGTTEAVIDASGTTAHGTGQFSYFPVRVNVSEVCPPTLRGCPPPPEVALLQHPTVSWSVTTRGAATATETNPLG